MNHSQAGFILTNQVWFNLKRKKKKIFSHMCTPLTDKGEETRGYQNKCKKSTE